MEKTNKNISLESTPFKTIALGFLTYVLVCFFLLSLPFCQKTDVSFADNLFNVVSAISTTGLVTAPVSELYTFYGNLILLIFMQLGGIGYMTLTSAYILSKRERLSKERLKILSAEFPLPKNFEMPKFVLRILLFTFLIECIGTLILWREFYVLGIKNPFWQSVYHTISAFTTSGFSLFNNNLESFQGNIIVNVVISFLCYAGAIGYIIPMDIYKNLKGESEQITFTTKVILYFTGIIFLGGTLIYYFCESGNSLLNAAFQIMSASTTSGFNTVLIENLPPAVLALLMFVMIIGASPSGTGGGVKTTTVASLLGIVESAMRGHPEKITFLKRIIPSNRVSLSSAIVITYIFILFIAVFFLLLTEHHTFLQLCFETVSALGTVGMSMGITHELSDMGKYILSVVMFLGRVGPLTFGLAFFYSPQTKYDANEKADLVA